MTRTPWVQWRDDYLPNIIFIGPRKGETKLRVWHPDQEKTAQDVLRAVNSHDKLVAALEKIAGGHTDAEFRGEMWGWSQRVANKALAEAKGEG
jgi:hypothetical protein